MSFTARISATNALKLALDAHIETKEFRAPVKLSKGYNKWHIGPFVDLVKQYVSKGYHNYYLVGAEAAVKEAMAMHCHSDNFCFRTMNFK